MFTTEQADAVERVVEAVVAARAGTGPGRHFVVEAVAGAGKTQCLREMMKRLRERDPGANILYLTFNCEAAARLRAQECLSEPDKLSPVPERVVGCTMHAFGLRLLRRDVPDVRIDENKLFRLWVAHYGQPVNHPVTGRMRREAQDQWRLTRRYVEGRRNAGRAALLAADHEDADDNNGDLPAYVRTVWRAALSERSVIDQDEAIGHCLVYGARPHATEELADLVLVDECQDLNKANLDFLAHCVAVKERVVVCAVGDRSQAI